MRLQALDVYLIGTSTMLHCIQTFKGKTIRSSNDIPRRLKYITWVVTNYSSNFRKSQCLNFLSKRQFKINSLKAIFIILIYSSTLTLSYKNIVETTFNYMLILKSIIFFTYFFFAATLTLYFLIRAIRLTHSN